MGHLAEIISRGIAPGFNTGAKDPGCPQVAVPRALRQLEDQLGSRSKEMFRRGAGFTRDRLKEIWLDGKKKRRNTMKTALLIFTLMLGLTAGAQSFTTRIVPESPGTSLVASRIISTRAVKVQSVLVLNTGAATQYIQIHETTTLPANGVAPKVPSIPVGAGQIVMFEFVGGLDLAALTVCNSSTAATKTIGSADCMISVVVRAN